MEINFDMDNFEHSLKQHADEFSMIPSKRVWNGVYNSLHPGSKWPSLTMLLFFVLTLIGIGPLNHFSKTYPVTTLPDHSKNTINEDKEARVISMNTYLRKRTEKSGEKQTDPVTSTHVTSKISSYEGIGLQENELSTLKNPIILTKNISEKEKTKSNSLAILSSERKKANTSGGKHSVEILINRPDTKSPSTIPSAYLSIDKENKPHSIVLSEDIIIDDARNLSSFLTSNPGKSILIEIENIDGIDEEHRGTEELQAVKSLKKGNSKTTWIFFATPAVTTTYFTGKSLQNQNLLNASPLIVNPNQIGNTMRFNARLGLNVGAEMNYEFAEGWEIVTGTQLSYSGYNILAHKVHPSFSYLYLKNDVNVLEPKMYMTFYGSGEGLDEITLHNNSIHLSVPVGIKYSIWNNNKVEIKIGTSVQPSLVLNSHAHILSSDGRNYVTDQELMRNTNISGELNSSISFQGEKVKWHIGPTIRYQALSSYKKIYPVNEHLIDYGIRIGISK